jgi:hypothetical protein
LERGAAYNGNNFEPHDCTYFDNFDVGDTDSPSYKRTKNDGDASVRKTVDIGYDRTDTRKYIEFQCR